MDDIQPVDFPKFNSYEQMEKSDVWLRALASLNGYLKSTLIAANARPILNGNLFYLHLQKNFFAALPNEILAKKRRNLFKLAQASNHMLEVGVNGGHSVFLALSANPNLECTGIDICQKLDPRWANVEIYVPAAFRWLSMAFPGRFTSITGNSLIEMPRYAIDNPERKIDLLHLDGAKDTHLREVMAVRRNLTINARIILDDANLRDVRVGMRQMMRLRFVQPEDLSDLDLEVAEAHSILRVRT